VRATFAGYLMQRMAHAAAILMAWIPAALAHSAAADDWKVGLAKVVITPDEPVWLSGYSSRTAPAEG
jgi:hypothetical protein